MPSSSCFYLYTENLSLPVLLPIFACKKDTCQNLPVSLLYFSKMTHLYSIKGIGISSVQTSFPYIMMIWKQWQPADMVKLSDFALLPFNRFAFKIMFIFSKNKIPNKNPNRHREKQQLQMLPYTFVNGRKNPNKQTFP